MSHPHPRNERPGEFLSAQYLLIRWAVAQRGIPQACLNSMSGGRGGFPMHVFPHSSGVDMVGVSLRPTLQAARPR